MVSAAEATALLA
jgi:hypothetical protein